MSEVFSSNIKSPDLVDLLPLNAKRVIDIGCGTGEIAKEFRSKASPDYYLGIEIVPEDALIARSYCSECRVGNIEEFNANEWTELENFDLWVFGDVLEHLYDPWEILKKVRKTIAKDGQLMCCIPNAQHWSIQARLSIGDWRYAEKGLLDRTHIRFFTRQTIIEMINEAGFEIQEIVPRFINHPLADRFLDIIEKMAQLTGGDPKVARDDASVFQYIVKCR